MTTILKDSRQSRWSVFFITAALVVIAALAWAPGAFAQPGYFSSSPPASPTTQACTGCHTTSDFPSGTCAACHGHGTHPNSTKNTMNVTATPNSPTYAPGATVTVTIGGGYRNGSARAKLWDKDCSTVTCTSTDYAAARGNLLNGQNTTFGGTPNTTLQLPAPTTPGTYTWSASWYGNIYDRTERGNTTTFGPLWLEDPNNGPATGDPTYPAHGDEIVTFSFTVQGATNTPPVANNDSYSTPFQTQLSVPAPGVLGNDTDADNDTLTAVLQNNVSNGSLTLNANGSFTYTPNAGFSGADTFTYLANDGTDNSNTAATVTITVGAPANTPPVANDDSYSTPFQTQLSVPAPGVLGNDTDADNDTLSAVLQNNVSNGSLTLNANGSFTYTPNAGFSGADTFTYLANDGTDNSNTAATVTITVGTPANTPPVANNDSYSTPFQTLLSVPAPGVLGNDTDADNDTLSAVLQSGVGSGTLNLNSNGSFTFDPAAGFSGDVTFTYVANDGTVNSNVATVTITVGSPANTPPVANNDSYSTPFQTLLSVPAPGVLGNDTDADNDTLSAVLQSGVSSGTLNLNSNGSFTYTPATGFSGVATFTYVANDATANSNVATVTITVQPPVANQPPVSNPNGPYTGTAGQAVSFDGSASSDPDGTIVSYAWSFGDGGSGSGATPSHTYAAAGTYTVSLTVTDNNGATNTAMTTATIQPASTVCTGLNITQSSWSNRRNRLSVDGDGGQRNGGDFVLTNAYDATQVLATGSRNRDREFRFRVTSPTPVPCRVRVEQPNTGRCAEADVNNAPANCGPTPPPPNLPPVSDPNGPYMGIEGQPVSFDGTGSSDPDGTIVSYAWTFGDGNTGSGVSPSHTYAAAGSYIVNLTVTDDDGATDTASTTAVIDPAPVGGGVTARGDLYSTPVGNPITVTATRLSGVLYNDFGGVAPLTAELLSGPSSGSLSAFGADGSFTYSPGAGMTDNAIDQFTYQAVDANGATSAPATVVIQALSKQVDFKITMNYELGMHCTGFEFAYCCVLPPYNSILAQVIKPAQGDPAGGGGYGSRSHDGGGGGFVDGFPRLLEGDPNVGLDGLNRETVLRDWDHTTSQFKKYQLRYYHDAQPRQEGNTGKPNTSTLISAAEGNSLQYFNTVFDSAQPDGNNALVYGPYNGYDGVIQGSGVIGDVATDNYANAWLNHFYIYVDPATGGPNLEGHGNTGLEANKIRLGVAGQVEYPANSGAGLQPLGPTGNGAFENLLTFSGDTGTVVFTQAKVLEDLPITLTSPRIWEALGLPLTPFEDTIGFFADPGAVDEDAVRPYVAMKASLHEYPSGNEVIGSNGEPVIGFGTAPIDIPNCERCHSAPSIDPVTGNPNVNSPNWNRADYSYPHGGPLAGTGLEAMTNLETNFWLAYYDIIPGVDSTWYPRLKGAAINMLTLHDYDIGTSFTANYAGVECSANPDPTDPNIDPQSYACSSGNGLSDLTNTSNIPQNTRLGNESVICQRCHADNVIANVRSGTSGGFPIPPITEAIHNQHRNASEGGVIVFNDSLGRDGGCQGCHPAHRSDGVMDNYPITLGGNNVNANGDNRLNPGGCFVGRDVHSNPMKDIDGAETPSHLNAVGDWLNTMVADVNGEDRGIWCTNCHSQLSQEIWRTEDCHDLIRGNCVNNPRGEPTLADVAAAVGWTEQQAIDSLDPKVNGFDRTTDLTHAVWDPANPDANVATIEVDGGGNPVVTTDADGDISVNILSFCTTDDCVAKINANKTDQSQWRYAANAFIDPVNNSGAPVPFSAATDGRDHWLAPGEPHCADCHQAPFTEQSGNFSAYPPFNYPAKASLMRYTRGHQDVSCQGCHESIHGLYPVTPTIDSTSYAQAAALNNDGSHGPLKCAACHTHVDGDGIPTWVDNLRYNDPTTPGNDNLPVAGNFDRAVSWMHTYTEEADPTQDVCKNCHGDESDEIAADKDEWLEHAMRNRVSRGAMDAAERAVNNGRVLGELPGRQRRELCSECHGNELGNQRCDREWREHLIQGRVSPIVWEDLSAPLGGCGW